MNATKREGSPFQRAHPGALLIPAEALGERGLRPEARAKLCEEEGLSEGHVALFERGYALYRERAADLYARAPGSWLPPRKANLLLATDPARVRPYSAPFFGMTWFLYASDLDPAYSHEEWVAFQLFHVERLAFLKALRAAVCFNLSYFLTRTEDELHDFSRAASRAVRPDAPAFVALARALHWIRSLYHVPLHEPPEGYDRPLGHVEGADLLVPREVRPELVALLEAFDTAARAMEASFLASQAAPPSHEDAGRTPADELCAFLREERPDVLLVDRGGHIAYQPELLGPLDEARAVLEGIGHRAAKSLRDDLALVSAKSSAVLASLRDPSVLPSVSEDVETGGGVYVRADLRRIAYELRQPGFDPLREEAPPLHRELLAARVVHEWGHLAHEANLVRVPPTREAEYDDAVRALEERWSEIVAAVPARLEEDVDAELAALDATRASAGRALARVTLSRIPDWASNLFFRRYLDDEELEAYVRTNVRHHLNEDLGPLAQLARHAVEIQYLRLGSIPDPMGYFLETTYFGDYFLRTGVFGEEAVRALFDATTRVCTCFELDASSFFVPPRGADPGAPGE